LQDTHCLYLFYLINTILQTTIILHTGLAWGAGVLAILTALLPVVLQGGEEEFEKMKEQDSGTWGKGSADPLNKKRRR